MTSDPGRKFETLWRTVGFQPAPPGWRVEFTIGSSSLSPGMEVACVMPGWLIQDEYLVDTANHLVSGLPPARRVIAGTPDEKSGCIVPVDEPTVAGSDNFKVLAPGPSGD